jgi:hypothetical protein
MCVVPTLNFERLFAFVVLGHGRRQLLWFEVTRHPTAEWPASRSGLMAKRCSVRSIMVLAAPTSAWRMARDASTSMMMPNVNQIIVGTGKERRSALGSRQADGALQRLCTLPRAMPHVLVNEEPGSSRIRASPVRNAFGGQVIGSTARLRRLTLGSGSPLKSIKYG